MFTRALVISLVASVLTLVACSRERSDWRSAQASDSPDSYQQFIEKHPGSAHVAAARERLVQLAEEQDWRTAAVTDTPEAYRQFLAAHPGGKWAREAQLRIDNFNANAAVPGSPPPGSPGLATPGEPATFPDATPPVAAGSTGAFGVQLGAFSTPERANDEWKKLQAEAGGTLDGLSPRVVVGEAGGRTIYRLQAEVRDEAQARAICGGLKVANKPCVPVLPH